MEIGFYYQRYHIVVGSYSEVRHEIHLLRKSNKNWVANDGYLIDYILHIEDFRFYRLSEILYSKVVGIIFV